MPFQFRKEAIEEDLNTNFPSQGQGNPPLYYSLSEVVVPTYSINDVAEGTSLPEILQTAWDFSSGSNSISNTTATIILNTGFWRVLYSGSFTHDPGSASGQEFTYQINDGVSNKVIFAVPNNSNTVTDNDVVVGEFVVFLRSGDSLTVTSTNTGCRIDSVYRQIADVNGNLVNPLGFSFA